MVRHLDALLYPRAVAVVGASDETTSYGGRAWRYLRRDFRGVAVGVNRRSGAVKSGPCAASLSELDVVPDVAVLAIPGGAVADVLREAGELGVRAAVVLARDSLGHERELRSIADEGDVTLLGPNCLGLIHANMSTALSSSISLERPLRPGPFALVSQSGALMGVLHARAADLGLGLGLCVSTGSQAQLAVEDFLTEIARMEGLQVVAAYMEDIDVQRFEMAANALRASGKRLVVLKSGASATGQRATRAHTQALTSDGRMFGRLSKELGVVTVGDPNELLAAFSALRSPGRRVFLVTVSGGLAAIAADRADELGLELPMPSAASRMTVGESAALFGTQGTNAVNGEDRLKPALASSSRMEVPPMTDREESANGSDEAARFQAVSNPLDLEATDSSMQDRAGAIQALVEDDGAGTVLLLVNDMPGMEDLLDAVGPVWDRAAGRLIVGSECSLQSNEAWSRWVATGRDYVDDWTGLLRVLSSGHPTRERVVRTAPPESGQMAIDRTMRLLERAGIPVAAWRQANSQIEAVCAAGEIGYPVVVKVANSAHRGAAGVRLGLETEDALLAAYDDLERYGAVMVQAQVGGGLEFYVGVIVDERFGLVVVVGGGGSEVEHRSDVAIARCPISQEAISRLIAETAAGRWLSTTAARGLVDLESLAMVAHRATLVAADLGGDFSTLDLNPVVVGPAGAVVVDAKIALRTPDRQGPWGGGGSINLDTTRNATQKTVEVSRSTRL